MEGHRFRTFTSKENKKKIVWGHPFLICNSISDILLGFGLVKDLPHQFFSRDIHFNICGIFYVLPNAVRHTTIYWLTQSRNKLQWITNKLSTNCNIVQIHKLQLNTKNSNNISTGCTVMQHGFVYCLITPGLNCLHQKKNSQF